MKQFTTYLLAAGLLCGASVLDAEARYNFGWDETIIVTAPMPSAMPVAQRIRPPAPMQGQSAPGMDLGIDGVSLPINLQDHIPTDIAPEWNPIYDMVSPTGEMRVGDTTTVSVRDCRENIGRVEWHVKHQFGERDPVLLTQQGRCRMQVRWRSSGNHLVSIAYSYKYYEGEHLRTVTSVDAQPQVVEVLSDKEFNTWKALAWSAIPAVVGAGVQYYRNPDADGKAYAKSAGGPALAGLGSYLTFRVEW